MADGQVVFEITGDPKGINSTIKQVTGNIQSESKKWDDAAGQATGGIEKSFSNMAGKIVGSLAAAGISSILLNWGKAAVDAASDLAEVQNVVDTVFGDGANQIESWAKKAGQQFGLTETQAKKFTSTLGAMMKSSGIAGKEIINMSTDLAGLAADMASFYNLDFETSFEKIRAGISGETEPLKQLGINMSVANLNAFALAQGLEKTFDKMSQGEQTMLRYQYIMQATADAQGDFEKTSEGFANAQRRIETALNTIQTVAGKFILNTIEPLVSGFAGFLEQLTATPERTVLDDFNDAEINAEEKLASIQDTYEKASDLLKILKDIEKETVTLQDGSTISLDKLFENLGDIEKNGGNVQEYIESLGLDVDYVVQKYNQWKEATRQLTSVVPALTSQIDSETGAINGGTAALEKNLEEWKRNEENKVYWAEYYAKAEAVARAKGEQAGIQITAKARQLAADRARNAVSEQAVTLGIDLDYYTNHIDLSKYQGQRNVMTEEQRKYNDSVDEYVRLQKEADEAQKKADTSANDLADAEALLADELAATEEITGQTLESVQEMDKANQAAASSAKEWGDKEKKSAEVAASALKAVNDYYRSVRDSTAQAVNSVINGFERVGAAGDELRKKSNELAGEETEALTKYASVWNKWGSDNEALKKMKAYVDAGNELTDMEKEAYEALVKVRNAQKEVNEGLDQYKPDAMKANLQSQLDFMQNYLDNLNKAREMGLSDELLASLSDGSKDSAEFLAGLVNGGSEAAQEVDALYQEVQKQKKGFTDSLTEQKLAVDDTYSSMVEAAKEAMEGLDLGEEAEAAMGSTLTGIAQGISKNVPEVSAAIDSLMAELNRLSDFGFTFGFSDGSFLLELDGSNEKGLDYVPFDGYLSELHEGEGILTAEENRIWQQFKNGQAGHANVDYETLGNVMRDNVKAGGNVYLDGRTVGHVISDAQGRSFRALQRSGWQG